MARVVLVKNSEEEVADKLCNIIIECAETAIKERGLFVFGVSGGSVASFLSKGFQDYEGDTSRWHMFFCDERHVDLEHVDSNYKAYKDGLLQHLPLRENQVYKINASLLVEEAAADYTCQMKSVFAENCDWPRFDVLVLGMGPDGHTCSLFPGHPLLSEDKLWVASLIDSPKPPPSRITLTLPVVNSARISVFALTGSSKAQVTQRILEGDEGPPLPAGLVSSEKVYWILDREAASELRATDLQSSL